MQAPEQEVVLGTGESRNLAEFYKDRPAMLVFVRHLGCGFCKEQVAMLRDSKANIVFVSMDEPQQITKFREHIQSPHPFISDPKRELFKAFGLAQGTFSQMVNVRTMAGTFRTLRKGFSMQKPRTDPRQMGGAFLVQPDGRVSWFRKSRDAADNVTAKEIEEALSVKR